MSYYRPSPEQEARETEFADCAATIREEMIATYIRGAKGEDVELPHITSNSIDSVKRVDYERSMDWFAADDLMHNNPGPAYLKYLEMLKEPDMAVLIGLRNEYIQLCAESYADAHAHEVAEFRWARGEDQE